MWTSSLIKRHIFQLSLGRIFTTREVLLYGPRSAVDQCLSCLVKKGIIIRLARGVFVKEGSRVDQIAVEDVAKAKAEAFGKQIATWGGELASRLGLAPESQSHSKRTFCVSGSSSSFKFREITVVLRKTCARKMSLNGSAPGQFLHALWHIGLDQIRALTSRQVSNIRLNHLAREEIRLSVGSLPAWLAALFLRWRLPGCAIHCPTQQLIGSDTGNPG